MARRRFLTQLAALPFIGAWSVSDTQAQKPLKIMMKSAWGSDDPTKAAFPFLHGHALAQVVAKKIPIYACGACSRARGVMEADLAAHQAKFGNPEIFVALVEWADRIVTE